MDREKTLFVMLFLYIAMGILACVLFFKFDILPAGAGADAPSDPPAAPEPYEEASSEPAEIPAETSEPDTQEEMTVETESAETAENMESMESTETAENTPEPEYTYTVVRISRKLRIRSGPSTDYEIIDNLNSGDRGEVISIGDEWVLLRHGDVEGYVFKEYLKIVEKETGEALTQAGGGQAQ